MNPRVDMDQLLNQQYMGFQEKGKDRMSALINSILGQGAGAAPEQSFGSAFGQSAGGYLSGGGFQDILKDLLTKQPTAAGGSPDARAGFTS